MHGYDDQFVGKSTAHHTLLAEAGRVAPRDTTVLLTGESGTGKELVARYIHRLSPRCDAAYVTCDCAALPAGTLEGELFGHRRGAFTGAFRDAPGYMASSDRGTLFLDEVGELDLRAQTRLLRFLEARTVTPLGAVWPRELDVRIIAATNRDLDGMLQQGMFRDDLYYRLNVVNLHVAPLRERREDILPLADHFRCVFAAAGRKTVVGFTPQARDALLAWSWPGNVRELRNAVERAVIMCRGTWIDRADLPARMGGPGLAVRKAPRSFAEPTARFQRGMPADALRAAGGDRRRAAQALDLTAHQMKYLVRKLGLPQEDRA